MGGDKSAQSKDIEKAKDIASCIKPLEYFKEYLECGYYPFYFDSKQSYCIKLEETINTVIESDLPIIFNIEPSTQIMH
jgi:predicted AAA+ superfamily ATPase